MNITATKIANSRESIIYKSELNRIGDGEYRLPTIREAAIIMGFPITYQFLGADNNKWRLVGNAVCCSVSRAIAKMALEELRYTIPNNLVLNNYPHLEGVTNLNTYKLKVFEFLSTSKPRQFFVKLQSNIFCAISLFEKEVPGLRVVLKVLFGT
jgi:DNA (cytosine-5)-methyltransferase 1